MKVSVILAYRGTANPQDGTLNLLGAGWRMVQLVANQQGILTPPHVVVVFFEVDYAECNHVIPLELSLVTEDGQSVLIPRRTSLERDSCWAPRRWLARLISS